MIEKAKDRPDPDVFPLRVAATDIGSNAIRFVAAEFSSAVSFRELDQIRVPVRLGHDVFLTGRLTDDAVDAAAAALEDFARRLAGLDIAIHRAVATSAVRESRNGEDLIERVHDRAGIAIEPITGAEEARLVHIAVRSRIEMGRRKWLVADLGGGSVEVSIVDQRGIHRTESHEMGSVRLLEELAVAGEEPGRFRRRLDEYTAALRESRILQAKVAGFIATGGNIESIARLAGAEPDAAGVSTLSVRDMRAVIERLARLSYEDRVRDLALREDRADVILPAGTVYERLAALAGVDNVLVPNVGVKDGVMLDLVEQRTCGGASADRLERLLMSSAIALGRQYHFDEAHARHVAELGGILFDQLAALHELPRADRRLLMAAALLHDIGIFISPKRHHKHSAYIIRESELADLSRKEIRLVAAVARYHRKSAPSERHPEYAELNSEDRERVRRLSALLRITEALDREHLQQVARVSASVRADRLDLLVDGSGDLLLERWALGRNARLFEEIFQLPVRLEFRSVGG